MPTLSGKQILITAALVAFVLLFAFQGTVSAARLAGNAQPVATTSTEPIKEGTVMQKPAGEEEESATAPVPKKNVPARKKVVKKPSPKKAAPTRQIAAKDADDNGGIPTVKAAPGKPGSANEKLGKYVTIDFDNVDILAFIKFISELTGKNFVVDEAVKGKVSVFSPRKISSDEAYRVFESVLEIHGLTTVPAATSSRSSPASRRGRRASRRGCGQRALDPTTAW